MPQATAPRSRLGRRLVIGVVVLLLVLLGIDRLGNYVAERAAAATIQRSAKLPGEPDVDIAGFPFLTQLAAGRFDEITVTITGLELGSGGAGVRVSRLVVTLHTVHVSRDLHSVRADSATATGLITYADLGRPLGATLRYEGGGRVRASKSITVAGRTLTGSLSAKPQLSGTTLTFGEVATSTLGRLATRLLAQVFDTRVALDGLPLQISLQSLRATASGIQLGLSGQGLSFVR